MPISSRNNFLYFDFRYEGVRCREYTKLTDTPANRKQMQKVMDKIELEITLGTFSYADFFPNSPRIEKFKNAKQETSTKMDRPAKANNLTSTPTYQEFAEQWFMENEVLWRDSHKATIRSTLDRHLIAWFGVIPVGDITKEETLKMRSYTAKLKGM